MKVCTKCGVKITSGKLCVSCRNYIKKGGVWHELPPYGEVRYDDEGRPICHVCGMAFDKLIEHTIRKHGLDSLSYRQTFGLMLSARLTGPKYHEKMRQHVAEKPTYKVNFETTHNGEKRHKSGRSPGWSEQERKARMKAQAQNGSQSKKNLTAEQLKVLGRIWAKNLPNCKV